MILSAHALKRAVDTGRNLDEAAREIVRYGQILKDTSWEVSEGRYAGSHRVRAVSHQGLRWRIVMHNGEVTSLGYTVV